MLIKALEFLKLVLLRNLHECCFYSTKFNGNSSFRSHLTLSHIHITLSFTFKCLYDDAYSYHSFLA